MRHIKCLSWILVILIVISMFNVSVFAGEKASIIRIESTEGFVYIRNEVGKEAKLTEGMKLYSGYTIITFPGAKATISLDNSKSLVMSSITNVSILKKGKSLEVLVNSGEVFFNVTSPVKENENFEVKTSNMTMGIRGTSGGINKDTAYIFTGKAEVSNSLGEKVYLSSGETASKELRKNKLTPENVSTFMLNQVAEYGLVDKMIQESRIDVYSIINNFNNEQERINTVEQNSSQIKSLMESSSRGGSSRGRSTSEEKTTVDETKFDIKNPTETSTEKSTEETTETSTEKFTEEITEASTEKPTEETTETSTEKHTEETTETSTEKHTEETTETTTEKHTEETTETTTENSTEETTEKPTEQTTEDAKEIENFFKEELDKYIDEFRYSESELDIDKDGNVPYDSFLKYGENKNTDIDVSFKCKESSKDEDFITFDNNNKIIIINKLPLNETVILKLEIILLDANGNFASKDIKFMLKI